LLGYALAQSGYDADYSDERTDYSYDYSLGNSHSTGFGGSQSYSFNNFGEKAYATGTSHVEAERLSCWNSNSMRDMSFDGKFYDGNDNRIGTASDTNTYHHYNHQYGFENTYTGGAADYISGSSADFGDNVRANHFIDVSDDDHSVKAVNPQRWGYQSNNRDAKYHYGHYIHEGDLVNNVNRPESSQAKATFDGVIDDWRFSLRHAGCLYEASDYYYSGTTFNALRYLTYSQSQHEYGGAVTTGTLVTNVHWVHVFNAHLHIDGNTYCQNTDHAITSESCINTDRVHQFAVVMANPTYEGLGFLNFVATYHDNHDPSTEVGYAGHRFRSNFSKSAQYENSGFWHLSATGADVGNANTDLWHFQCDTGGCDTSAWKDQGGTMQRGLAISSFPHNQLGKDFRFNIRTLHTMGDGHHRANRRAPGSNLTAYSYFFYAINQIVITFPEYVAHVNDCWRQSSCTSDMIHQIITDQSAVQTTSASPQNNAGDIAYGNYQLYAYLSASDTRCDAPGIAGGTRGNNNCASWCDTSGQTMNGQNSNTQTTLNTSDHRLCGNVLTIKNMEKTYDELHLRQFGTIQEIWVQLMFAFSHPTEFTSGSVSKGFESPFPNVFFSAPQVSSVVGTCTGTDAYSKCNGYTRAENMPYAGTDTDADRWVDNVDGNTGVRRGDGFWVDDWDVSTGR